MFRLACSVNSVNQQLIQWLMNAEHLCFQFQVDGIRQTSLVENKLSGLSFLRVFYDGLSLILIHN